jgi:GST-like protein
VLNQQLEGRDFICDDYSIADMACWPWVSRHEWHRISLGDYPQVRAWYRRILSRDAVQKGYHVPVFANEIPAG